jgi:hypothetical protein
VLAAAFSPFFRAICCGWGILEVMRPISVD